MKQKVQDLWSSPSPLYPTCTCEYIRHFKFKYRYVCLYVFAGQGYKCQSTETTIKQRKHIHTDVLKVSKHLKIDIKFHRNSMILL